MLLVGIGSQGDRRLHGPLFVEIGEVCNLSDGLAKFACSMLIVVQLVGCCSFCAAAFVTLFFVLTGWIFVMFRLCDFEMDCWMAEWYGLRRCRQSDGDSDVDGSPKHHSPILCCISADC